MIVYISYFLPSKPAYTSPFSQSASSQQASKQPASSPRAVSKQSASSQQAVRKQSASSPQAVRKQSVSSPQAVRKQSASEMSVEQKNFVVGFRNDSNNINSIMEGGYGKNIMDIMVAINSCSDFEEAKKQKIPCIQDYIYKNMQHIDFLIYLYGQTLVIQDYINRFGPIQYSLILDVDFATIIIDNIIIIYEARQFPENTTPKSLVDSSVQCDSQEAVVSEEAPPDGYDIYGGYDSYGSYGGYDSQCSYDSYDSYDSRRGHRGHIGHGSRGSEEEEELQSTSQLINPDADITEFLSEL
jgi:hypothetical protein